MAGPAYIDSFRLIRILPDDVIIAADAVDDTLTLAAGPGISLVANAGSDQITIVNTNPAEFSLGVAGDDSSIKTISSGETIRFAGAQNVTVSADSEGAITITGPDLSNQSNWDTAYSWGDHALAGYLTSTAPIGNDITIGSVRINTNIITTVDSNADLELRASGTGAVFVESISVNGTTIDSADSSAITITPDVVFEAGVTVGNHIVPSSNENIDLGSNTNRFRDLYLSGSTIKLGDATISSSGANIALPAGTTIGGSTISALISESTSSITITTLTVSTGLQLDSGTTFNGGSARTISIDSTVTTLTGTQTLSNKTLTSPIISSISNTGTLTLPTSTDTLVGRATADTLTNKTFTDSTTLFQDETDNTKKLAFQLSGITTGNTRTLTVPNASGTITLDGNAFFVGTTSVANNRASANLALTGISSVQFPGSTSGTVTLQPVAIAGTATITLPAITGTVVTTGDTGSVTNTMLANSSITINGSAVSLGGSISVTVSVPTGVILMWSGSIATIPAGWLLCNGSNGTPDLRNRFIVGAGSTYAVDATGGSADAAVISHSHTVSGSTNSIGDHQHFLAAAVTGNSFSDVTNTQQIQRGITGTSNLADYRLAGTATAATVGLSSTTGSHSHTVSGTTSSEGSSGTNANLPPYYALCFIMKS